MTVYSMYHKFCSIDYGVRSIERESTVYGALAAAFLRFLEVIRSLANKNGKAVRYAALPNTMDAAPNAPAPRTQTGEVPT